MSIADKVIAKHKNGGVQPAPKPQKQSLSDRVISKHSQSVQPVQSRPTTQKESIADKVIQKYAQKTEAPKKLTGTSNPNYQKALSEATRYKQGAVKANSFGGIAKETGRGVAKSLLEFIPKTAVSVVETPGALLRQKASQREYNIPVIGKFKSYQSEAEDTAGDIVEGKKPLYSALKPFVELPLNFLPVGLKKSSLGTAYSSGQGIRRQVLEPQIGQKGSVPLQQGPQTPLPGMQEMRYKQVSQPTEVVESGFRSDPEKVAFSSYAQKLAQNDAPVNMSVPKKVFTSGGRILRESGEPGKKMEQVLRKQQLDEDLLRGDYTYRLKEATKGLTKKELENVTDVLEGKAKPISDGVRSASSKIRGLYDEVAGEAQNKNFEVRLPDGTSVPFSPRENYAPRIYNFDEITKSSRRDEMLQNLVESGQARNKAEASKLFDDFISANAERRAGNLENARMLDLPGYEKNAAKAGEQYLAKAAERFSQAENFGSKDERIADLIGKIADSGGDYMEAQRVFDFLAKGLPKSKIAKAVTQFNLATKLDLGAITNITQSVNTITKGGVKNFLKSAVSGKEGRRLADLAGVYDDMVVIKESGINPGKIVRGVMYLFGKVERMNRFLAANTGRFRAEELLKVAKKNPDAEYAVRQLKTLGIDPNNIEKLTEKDVLTAMNRMAELTQFKPTVLNVPPAWKTPFGRVATQFKSFSFMQTRFITDEILKEAKQGNIAPLMRFIATVPLFSFATYHARGLAKDPTSKAEDYEDKRNLDLREFDKYLGAGKSFYTEPLTQGDFLKDTYDNKYASPLKKIFRTAGTFLGPTVGEAGTTIDSLEQIADKNNKNETWYKDHPAAQEDPYLALKRQVVGSVPIVGEGLKNSFFDFEDSTAEQARVKAIEAIQKGDYESLVEAQSEDPYLRKQQVFSNLFKEAGKGKMTQQDKQMYQEFYDKVEKKRTKPFYTE